MKIAELVEKYRAVAPPSTNQKIEPKSEQIPKKEEK